MFTLKIVDEFDRVFTESFPSESGARVRFAEWVGFNESGETPLFSLTLTTPAGVVLETLSFE